MKYQLTSQLTDKHDTLILAVTGQGKFSNQGLSLVLEKKLKTLLKGGDLAEKHGKTLLIPDLDGLRIVLVYCEESTSREEYCRAVKKAYTCLKNSNSHSAVSYLHLLEIKDTDATWRLQKNITIANKVFYEFLNLKSKKTPSFALSSLQFITHRQTDEMKLGLKKGIAIADGLTLTKDLGNTPPNICTPNYLAKQAKKLSALFPSIRTVVYHDAQMKKLGMNTLLAVGQGSAEPSTFITLEYKGGKATEKPWVFVGKGITFDTGGISLKPSGSMLGMQYDMMGAATVLGLLQIVADLKWPINIVGVIASAENMPDGSAYKPGDVIKSLSGKTIEITNTDAEGRLVLCDALTYCERFNPKGVIDLATLTGGVVVALGRVASAIMGNNDQLVNHLLEASRLACDPCWSFPLYEELQDTLKSPIADLVNSPATREAQSIIAACFLSRFTEKYSWAHMDIAGTSHNDTEGATGRPLEVLVQFLESAR